MKARALKLYAHTADNAARPRELFVLHHGARALASRALLPSALTHALGALHIARARTELGLCARCEHILAASERVAIDPLHELTYCLSCWTDDVDGRKDPLP